MKAARTEYKEQSYRSNDNETKSMLARSRCLVCLLIFGLVPLVACADDTASCSSKAKAVAETQFDASRLMVELWLERSKIEPLTDDSQGMLARYFLNSLAFARQFSLEPKDLGISHLETICLLDSPDIRQIYEIVPDGGLKSEAFEYLSQFRDEVQSSIAEGQAAFGGSGCYVVRKLGAK